MIKDKVDAWILARLQARLEREKRAVVRKKWQLAQLQADFERIKREYPQGQQGQQAEEP